MFFFPRVNSFWTVLNKNTVMTRIKKSKKQSKGGSIMTFDFSVLYTKVPHRKLLKVLYKLIFVSMEDHINTSVQIRLVQSGFLS